MTESSDDATGESTTSGPDETTSTTTASETTTSSGSASESSGGNTNPDANDDVLFTLQGDQLVVDAAQGVLANDIDPDGDALLVADADAMSAKGGVVAVAPDGSLTYTPPGGLYADYWGPDNFDYMVDDGVGGAAFGTVTIYVAPATIPTIAVSAESIGGFEVQGQELGDNAGESVAGAGDVNGDGLDDVIIGAPLVAGGGRGYVLLGSVDEPAPFVGALEVGVGGFAVHAEEPSDHCGDSVAAAGDMNADGLGDLVIGAPQAGPGNEGRAYVLFGKADTTLVDLTAVAAGDGGFVLTGESAFGQAGYSVSGAGDVNGDGLPDVVVGAPYVDSNGPTSGRSYVVFGKVDTDPVELGMVAAGVGGFAIDGEASEDRSGWAVGGGGDVNGDGLDDVLVGAGWSSHNGEQSGRGYVVFGKEDASAVSLSSVAAGGGAGFMLESEGAYHRVGISIGNAGDIDGDALDDVVIGAPGANPGGRTYVVLGKVGSDPVALASAASGMGGFSIEAEGGGDSFGVAVGGAGDVNGDGFADFVVGATTWGDGWAGASYVVYGKQDTFAVDANALAAGDGGFAVHDGGLEANLGAAVGGAGDFNGDGSPDIVIGAPATSNADYAYVIFGVPTCLSCP